MMGRVTFTGDWTPDPESRLPTERPFFELNEMQLAADSTKPHARLLQRESTDLRPCFLIPDGRLNMTHRGKAQYLIVG